MAFQLSDTVNQDRIFLVKRGELEGRLDPSFNAAKKRNIITSIYPKIPMGKLCSSLTGGTPSKDNPDFWNGSIPWISPKDFKQFYLNDSVDHISEKAIRDSSTRVIPENSVVIVVRSGVLIHTIPVAVTLKPMSINQDIKALVFCDKVLPAFAAYYIQVFQQKILPLITKHSTTVQSINTEQFEKLDLVVPPINIQQKVIAKMNEAYTSKKQKEAQAQQLLNSIDTYLLYELGIKLPVEEENSIQQRMFVRKFSEVSGGRFDPAYYSLLIEKIISQIHQHWGEHFFKEVIFDLYRYPTFYDVEYLDQGVIVIKGQNIDKNGEISLDQEFDHIDANTHKMFNRTHVIESDLIFTVRGIIGKVGLYKGSATANINANVMKIRLIQDVNPSFYWSYLNSTVGQLLIRNKESGQVQKTITVPDIHKIPIPLPPLEKQNEIAAHIQTIRDQAKQLRAEADAGLEQAKQEVEAIILGEPHGK